MKSIFTIKQATDMRYILQNKLNYSFVGYMNVNLSFCLHDRVKEYLRIIYNVCEVVVLYQDSDTKKSI